jgi:hypothetical protein
MSCSSVHPRTTTVFTENAGMVFDKFTYDTYPLELYTVARPASIQRRALSMSLNTVPKKRCPTALRLVLWEQHFVPSAIHH